MDTLIIAIGFILLQECENGKCYSNYFCFISLTSVESQYFQAKLELYSLFWALWTNHVFIFGATNFVVEMDMKYIE